MAFSGDLASIDLASVLQTISFNQKSGTLKISGPDEAYYLYFERGEITYFSAGKHAGNFLGQILLRMGRIRKEDLESVLAFQRLRGGVIGKLLVQLEAASPEDIEAGVRQQVQDAVYDLFSWKEAVFEFTEGPPPEEIFKKELGAIPARINPSSLVLDAARRADEWKIVKKYLPSFKILLEAQPGAQPSTEEETLLLTLLDGTRSVEGLIQASGLDKLLCCQNLIALIEKGSVRALPYAQIVERADHLLSVGQPAEALPLLEAGLDFDPNNQALRESLIDAYKGVENWDGVAQQYQILARQAAEQGDIDRALGFAEKGLGFSTADLSGYRELFSVVKGSGRVPPTLQLGKRLCEAHRKAGDLPSAGATYQELLDVEKLDFELWQGLARTLVNMDQRDEALHRLEDALGFASQRGRSDLGESIKEEIRRLTPEEVVVKAPGGPAKRGAAAPAVKEERQAGPFLVWGIAVGFILFLLGGIFVLNPEVLKPENGVAQTNPPRGPTGGAGREVVAPPPVRETGPEPPPEAPDPEREAFEKALAAAIDLDDRGESEEALSAYRALEGRSRATRFEPRFAQAVRKRMEKIAEDFRKAEIYRANMERALKEGSIREANEHAEHLLKYYPRAPAAREVAFRVRIVSRPGGASVRQNGKAIGATPIVATFRDGGAQKFEIQLDGFRPVEWTLDPKRRLTAEMDFPLEILPLWVHPKPDDAPEVPEAVEGRPATSAGEIVYATRKGTLVCLPHDPSRQGGLKWQRKVGDQDVEGAPLIHLYYGPNQRKVPAVFVGTNGGHLYGYDLSTGDRPFEAELGGPIKGSPVALNDFLVAAGSSRGLTCFDTRSGRKVWHFPTAAAVEATPFVHSGAGGTIVFGSNEGKVFAVSFAMKKRFEFPLDSGCRTQPLLWNNHVVVGSVKGKLQALALGDRAAPLWKAAVQLTAELFHEGAVDGDHYFAVTQDGMLHDVDLKAGAIVRQARPAGRQARPSGPPVAGEGVVYAAFESGTLYALRSSDLEVLWRFDTGGRLSSSPCLDKDYLLLRADNGRMYAFSRKAEGRAGEASAIPPPQ